MIEIKSDMSEQEYHAHPAVNRSKLLVLRDKSPRHFYESFIAKSIVTEKDSPALNFGRLIHTLLLEPHKTEDRFYISEKLNRTTKEGKAWWENVCQEIGDRVFIDKAGDFVMAKAIERSFIENKYAKKLIDKGAIETSLFWEDQDTSILCKSRPDVMGDNFIVDLKTTKDASPQGFKSDVYKYGYHIQAAMIQESVKSLLQKEIKDFFFICIEKEPPFCIGVYALSQNAIEVGRIEFKEYLSKLKVLLEKNEWNDYDMQEIDLPEWVYKIRGLS